MNDPKPAMPHDAVHLIRARKQHIVVDPGGRDQIVYDETEEEWGRACVVIAKESL